LDGESRRPAAPGARQGLAARLLPPILAENRENPVKAGPAFGWWRATIDREACNPMKDRRFARAGEPRTKPSG